MNFKIKNLKVFFPSTWGKLLTGFSLICMASRNHCLYLNNFLFR